METKWLDGILEDKYRLIRVLKNTDDSQIWELRHIESGNTLIKRMYKGTDAVYKILRGISHPNIPRVYDVYKTGGVVVLEEYIEGITVTEVLEIGLYEPIGAVRVMDSLCSALTVLHSKRIIHKDVKPENIMIDRTGTVKLIDYNAARIYKPHQSEDTRFMGTPGYVAPEQFFVRQTDERTDIYALGILMNVMLTGEHPSKRLYKGKLTGVIKKCIRPNPDNRYQRIADLWGTVLSAQ
jgi:serine/threonine protein kinase